MTGLRHPSITRTSAAALAAAALLTAGCGSEPRQDANEERGTYPVEVVRSSFPTTQHLAEQSTFTIEVRNAGQERIPNLAVTLHGFGKSSAQPDLADPEQALWIVDEPPRGGVTAYVDTWALGALAPSQSKTFRWRVTPVVAGTHALDYEVAAGLDGKARAVLEDGGGQPKGSVSVRVSDRPESARVDPKTGDVVRGGDGN